MRYLILSVLIQVATFADSFSQSSTATQDVRQVVGITKLTSSSNEAAERFLPLVTERLVDVVEGTNRFRLVDMTSEEARREALDEAKDNYKADNAFNVTDNASLVAEYTLTADVGSLRFIKQKEKGNDVYKADLVMTLKLINTSSGMNMFSETFTSMKSLAAISPERAVSNAFDTIQDQIRNSVLANFPIVTVVAKIREEASGKAKTLIVFGGTSMNIQPGQEFQAYILDKSFDPPMAETIGVVSITQNVASRYSIVNVEDGGERISSLIASGQSVRLRSSNSNSKK